MAPRELRVHEVMAAARAGLLRETGDDEQQQCWYEVDGRHVGQYPINELVAVGVLGYELELTMATTKKIVVRDNCGTGPTTDFHKIQGHWKNIVIIDDRQVAVDGIVYYRRD